MNCMKKHIPCRKIVFLLIALSLFMLIGGITIRVFSKKHIDYSAIKINGVVLPVPQAISAFSLTDTHGNTFTQKNLEHTWNMMFFGFTHCGMVCPVTLDALSKMYKLLQHELPQNQLPQIVFISVDPERDTQGRIDEYLTAFNPHFIGLRAEATKTFALEKQLHIAAIKMQADLPAKNHYTINHSSEILLFNPAGKLQAYFSYPHDPLQMSKDYQFMIKTFKG